MVNCDYNNSESVNEQRGQQHSTFCFVLAFVFSPFKRRFAECNGLCLVVQMSGSNLQQRLTFSSLLKNIITYPPIRLP